MSEEEEKYKQELAKAGVDLPELKEEATEEESEEAEAKEETKVETEEPKSEPLKDQPKEQRKRSIYDEYKDRKAELKTEKELRETAERERDELSRKLEDATRAKGTENADDAEEDAMAYAKKVGADPDLVKRIIEDARKGLEHKPDEALQKDLADFKQWKVANAKTIEQSMFNDEFEKVLPSLKQQYPTASAEEMSAIKKELDAISHTKDWHDKDLDYVAFKNADKLSALVSPKKRGMESKGRKDVEAIEYEFDPNADYAKMSPKERVQWEKQYKEMGKSEGLITDAQGKKLII